MDTLVSAGWSRLCGWYRTSVAQPPKKWQQKTTQPANTSAKIGLNVSKDKTKVMRINNTVDDGIVLDGLILEDVESFTYLGSVIAKDAGADKDIKTRTGKARSAFLTLTPVWRYTVISQSTKLSPFYISSGPTKSETRNHRKRQDKKEWRCKFYAANGVASATHCVNQKIMSQDKHQQWNPPSPPGKRHRGRPRATWRRPTEQELKATGKSWSELEKLLRNRGKWRTLVRDLSTSWS